MFAHMRNANDPIVYIALCMQINILSGICDGRFCDHHIKVKVFNIISIPKDYRSSLIKCNKYSGICYCSGISKFFHIIMFKNNSDK